ncbi:MAG: hypothetical protein ACO3GE_11575 [Steroidobacteraceae bacterium]|jgi:protein-tyrosine-phosphatase|nr:hypothetical protein [Gammaproteobacteria bacterium]
MKDLFVDGGNGRRSSADEVVARAIATSADATEWRLSSAGLKDKYIGDTENPRSTDPLNELYE